MVSKILAKNLIDRKCRETVVILLLAMLAFPFHTFAQNLDSSNYRLLVPEIGSTAAGTIDSTNYSQLLSPGLIDGVTFSSSNYETAGGFSRLVQASVPVVHCFETTTNGGSTTCSSLPGGDGMQGVCSEPGCYNRAKIEIDAQTNPNDTRYALQISTTSDFSANVSYVDATTRLLKSTLTINDFIPKCEWEGSTATDVCNSTNSTWQKHNILGLTPSTTYYVRLSAHTGTDSNGQYAQTPWGPSEDATTAAPTIAFDIDVAPNTSTPTNQPYTLDLGNLLPDVVTTSTDRIIVRTTTNALNGIYAEVKGDYGELQHSNTTDDIPAVSTNLASVGDGYGIRNDSTLNSAQNTANLGAITVSSTPVDFTDAGATHKVGGPTTSYVRLFSSNSLPLDTGIAAFMAKAKPNVADLAGNYREVLTLLVAAAF